jgi:hypothetical protein
MRLRLVIFEIASVNCMKSVPLWFYKLPINLFAATRLSLLSLNSSCFLPRLLNNPTIYVFINSFAVYLTTLSVKL